MIHGNKRKVFSTLVISLIAVFVWAMAGGSLWAAKKPAGAANDSLKIVEELETMISAGRKVISDQQDLFNDPTKGDKGFTPDVYTEKLIAELKQSDHFDLAKEIKKTNRSGTITKLMLDSMQKVMTDAQPLLNMKGMAFKGFLPAVFARKALETFNEKGTGIKGKITARIFRNVRNAPDDWEKAAIERFMSSSYPHGKPIFEVQNTEDGKKLRYIKPEYYVGACLKCHGEPKGEKDITGMNKEGFHEGEAGAALSFMIPVGAN